MKKLSFWLIPLALTMSAFAQPDLPSGTHWEDATVRYEAVVNGNQAHHYYESAKKYLISRDYTQAQIALDKALELGYEKPWDCLTKLALIKLQNGDEKAAQLLLEEALILEVNSNRS